MTEQDRIDALLLRYEELRARNTPVSAEELCQDCPELVAELKQQIRVLQSMDALLRGTESEAAPAALTTHEGPATSPISETPEALRAGSRYEVLRFHAKGGLGEVHVARDEELNRDVAVKRLQAVQARNPQSRSRFLREAKITSRLEHPNIVPVHSMGQDADGCPFYAMRFVEGQTLWEALEQFHRPVGAGPIPGERHLALRQLLSRFVAVCNTIAYAHSRGVVHRDIKPSNIMHGPYGETLVLDWGLAKEVREGESESMAAPGGVAERPLAPLPSVAATQTGDVIGTAPYMSPEQAAGRGDLVGPASDVYSLGATLYSILTGQPPFQGSQAGEVLDKVKRGEFLRPRDRRKDIPPALEAICLKAMALKPHERYATALDIAADLEHWLADEPVSVYRDGPAARLARWGRRHRALVTGAAALLLTAVVLLAIGIVLINQEKDRTKAAYARTEEARAAEAKRRQQTRDALDLLSSQVVDEYLAERKELLPEHRNLLEKAVASYEELARDTDQEEASRAGAARAYYRVAKIRRRLGQRAEAEAAALRSRELSQQLASDFPAEPGYRQDLARSDLILANLLAASSRTDDAERAYHDALKLYEQLTAEFPTESEYLQELAASHYSLGRLFYDTDRKELAENAYKQSLALSQRLADAYPQVPDHRSKLATIHTILGILYDSTSRPELAKQAHEKALLINQRLVKAHAEVPAYQQALAANFSNLANLDKKAGRTGSAEQRYLEARLILQRLVEVYPQVPEYQLYLAAINNNLGGVYRASLRADLAKDIYQQVHVIYQRLADTHPEVADYIIQLGGSCWNLGHLLKDDLAKPQEALEWYARAIGPLEALLRKDPRQAKAREVLLNVYGGRAVAFAMLGRHVEAEETLHRAEEIDQGQSRGEARYYGGVDIRCFRSRVLVLAGDHAGATAMVDELVKSKRLLGGEYFFLAFTYALAASSGKEDTKVSDVDRVSLSERYAAGAVELLRKAQAVGHFRKPTAVEELRRAKELDVLRSRADFQKIVSELEEKKQTDGGTP